MIDAPLPPANEPADDTEVRIIWEPANQEYMPMGHPPAPDPASPAALTDDELADAIYVHAGGIADTARLIAALRAKDERIKELEGMLRYLNNA